ncbi:hypothetical protein AB0K12_00185 [Nonomuraea sp. NPDC049419]|uniref:hypothetical protein n=1 Tax=Nonomuraea sp. NPDC049419 TaxID=3155772 RepID=UPI003412E66A
MAWLTPGSHNGTLLDEQGASGPVVLRPDGVPQRNMAVALLSSLLPLPISVAMAILVQSPYFLSSEF